jgi:MoCo/4Fe-4S cofactor protein with predicted Tat translocation signal
MSKRIWNHPAATDDKSSVVSWRSVGQLEDTPEFREWLDREFPQGAAELSGEEELGTTRRSFLKLMGASSALAGLGLASCRRPEAYILPYTQAPEWIIPGKALYYASSMPRSSGATPLVVTTYEGRPTKLAPNRLHPDSSGTDAFAQASVLDLYSPSRSRGFLSQGAPAKRADFEAALAALAANPAAKIGFVFGRDDSPTRNRLIKDLSAKYAGAKFYAYEALEGNAETALGDGVKLVPDFAKAERIVSLDCDFTTLDSQGGVTGFFNRRKPEGSGYDNVADAETMNRLYVVESMFSLTGGMADHRLRVAPSQVLVLAAQIARAVGVDSSLVSPIPASAGKQHDEWVNALVTDLKKHQGRSVVLAGSRQPAAVHHLALAINLALGNIGPDKALQALQTGTKGFGSLAALKKDIESGALDSMVLLTPANPVYDTPDDINFSALLGKVRTSIHLGPRTDATAHAATWHIPAAHYLESWSDASSARGVYTIVQPMILPLYPDCVSEFELLLALLSANGKVLNGEGENGAASPAYDAVRKTFAEVADATEASWKTALRDGFAKGTAYPVANVGLAASAAADIASAKLPAPDVSALEIVFATDGTLYDGRYADNGWLQESPDPISKLTWDNAALIAPETAKNLGIYDKIIELQTWNAARPVDGEGENHRAPMIDVTVNGKNLRLPVLVAFGQAENVIAVSLGYGQGFNDEDELRRGRLTENLGSAKYVGLVGVNRGFNAYPLRTSKTSYFATGATARIAAGERYLLALTQEHNAMYGRALAREISTQADGERGDFEEQYHGVAKQGNDAHAPENISLYVQKGSETWHPGKDGKAAVHLSDPLHQWAMNIDLSSCMGCNACLVACQAENNIPIVGKEQVARGREMHWIRMDRYYAVDENNKFDPGNPELVPQPVACLQCESAPCETVCPVNATVHTEDGLNAMAYNRCIGTRYCANNCPYKARRFNFFDYNKRNPLIPHNLYKGPFGEKQVGTAPHLQRNPNVTVRMRGVMEKCTYCVQRIKESVIRQKRGQKQEALVSGKPSSEQSVSTETLRVPVDSVKTACQEACPAAAITFGNLLDGDKSQVVRARNLKRSYELLHYVGTRPRTLYIARVKNPNKDMPDAPFIGKATIHMA